MRLTFLVSGQLVFILADLLNWQTGLKPIYLQETDSYKRAFFYDYKNNYLSLLPHLSQVHEIKGSWDGSCTRKVNRILSLISHFTSQFTFPYMELYLPILYSSVRHMSYRDSWHMNSSAHSSLIFHYKYKRGFVWIANSIVQNDWLQKRKCVGLDPTGTNCYGSNWHPRSFHA